MKSKDLCRDALDALATHESAISELYLAYAKRFLEHQPFWKRLAEDEARHSGILNAGKDSLADEGDEFDETKASRALAESSAKFVRRERERFETDASRSIESALACALKVERSFFETAVFSAFDESGESLKGMASKLASETALHIKLLDELLSELKGTAADNASAEGKEKTPDEDKAKAAPSEKPKPPIAASKSKS